MLYYSDDFVSLYLGDCREIDCWLNAEALITDPPYGIKWISGGYNGASKHKGIAGDESTASRDYVMTRWGEEKPAIVFGDFRHPVCSAIQVLVYAKSSDAGVVGSTTGFRRDIEAIYLTGRWPVRKCERSSILRTTFGSTPHLQAKYKHPHAKPLDVMGTLVDFCPPGVIADPFAGSGATLEAARNAGRSVIGIEIEEKYAETIANRLSQQPLFTE